MIDDIQDLLADILDDNKPLPNATANAHKAAAKGKPPMPREAIEAVTHVAVETFDPELLEIAAAEQALSSTQTQKAAEAVREHASKQFAARINNLTPQEPIPDDVFAEAHVLIDTATTLEASIEADLPKELVPSVDDAFRHPEQVANAVNPRLPRPRKKGSSVEAAITKVTQGVTGDELEVEGALANVKGAIFADTQDRQREQELETLRIPMPNFTSGDLASTMDIRNFATMVTLNTARWHAKGKDRKASEDVAAANDAKATAFEVRKHLLAGADEKLKTIHKAIDSARAKHYDLTLPWTTTGLEDNGRRTGARLLPNTLFFEYTKAMAECLQEMKTALEAFVPEYPNLIELAKKNLGKRFNAADYPNPNSIRQHFDLSFDFKPIPEGKDFKGLPQQQLDALAATINRKSEQMMENAMQDVWTRLYEAVTHLYERVASPDKTFHYTMMERVREVTRLLKHLNVTGHTDIENIRKYLDKFVCPHDAEELRKNNVLRQQVAAHAKNVLDKMKKVATQ